MIGGNTAITLQTSTTASNKIGEDVQAWEPVKILKGWLDLSSGDSNHTTYNAKIQESTHVFVCDYVDLGSIKAENCRAVDEDKLVYEVTLIDDPMKLHKHLEIFLKFTGGQ